MPLAHPFHGLPLACGPRRSAIPERQYDALWCVACQALWWSRPLCGSLSCHLTEKIIHCLHVGTTAYHRHFVVIRSSHGIEAFRLVGTGEQLLAHGEGNDRIMRPMDDQEWPVILPDLLNGGKAIAHDPPHREPGERLLANVYGGCKRAFEEQRAGRHFERELEHDSGTQRLAE